MDAPKGMKTGGGTEHGGYAIWETRDILSSAALRTVRCVISYARRTTSLFSARKPVGEGAYPGVDCNGAGADVVGTRFGKGIYTSSTSSKSVSVCHD